LSGPAVGCGATSPDGDPGGFKPSPDGLAGTSDAASKAQDALPLAVTFDQVVKVEVRQFSGHVYNLQTGCGWYVANGIIVSNCKCYLSYEDATAENTIRTEGYAAERRGLAQDQTDRMQMVNEARQMFVSQLPASAAARAAERDAARAQIAREMGAHSGMTVWPQDVSAADVAARVAGRMGI
jgi:hypothetical protein